MLDGYENPKQTPIVMKVFFQIHNHHFLTIKNCFGHCVLPCQHLQLLLSTHKSNNIKLF